MKIISGPKGSGKTKKIIDLSNSESMRTIGETVFINDREKYRNRLKTSIRYVNIDDYNVNTPEMLLGFLNGLIAANYDVKNIFIDNLLRITQVDGVDDLKEFFKGIDYIEEKHDVDFVLSVTSDSTDIPEQFQSYSFVSV